jgi:predicted signal transduction protein with EAL and GGDEF domain
MGVDMSPDIATRLRQYQADFVNNAGATFSEEWTLYPCDTPHTIQALFTSFELDDGRMATLIEATQDYELAPQTLRSSEALLHTPVMITLYDTAGTALYRNPAARSALAENYEVFADRFVDASMHTLIVGALDDAGIANETALVRSNSGERWHDISARVSLDAVTGDVAWLVSEVDVTGLKEAEKRAHYLASHDALTGLPNRHHLHATFTERLLAIKAAGEQGAVIFIDLDRFKHINDTMGHAAGDSLLTLVATRLRGIVRQSELVARHGGDEFLVLTSSHNIIEHMRDLGARIADSLSRPLRLHGRNTMVFFAPEMNAAVHSRVTLESDIRVGLEQGQFEVHYQPRVRVNDNIIVGAEALARWRHPRDSMVSPGIFIPVCEDTDLIMDLGAQVLRQAAQHQRAWRDARYAIEVSVNLSTVQVNAENFVETIIEAVTDSGADPEFIELEITESMLLGDDQNTIMKLNAASRLPSTILAAVENGSR